MLEEEGARTVAVKEQVFCSSALLLLLFLVSFVSTSYLSRGRETVTSLRGATICDVVTKSIDIRSCSVVHGLFINAQAHDRRRSSSSSWSCRGRVSSTDSFLPTDER